MKLRCPSCNHEKIGYGFSLVEFARQSIDVESTVASVAGGPYAVLAVAGGGLVKGIFAAFKNEVIDGIPSNPLLRCRRCFRFSVVCAHCGVTLDAGDEQPGSGALFDCSECSGRFGHCETSEEFDSLVSR